MLMVRVLRMAPLPLPCIGRNDREWFVGQLEMIIGEVHGDLVRSADLGVRRAGCGAPVT
jgi:hypothetical protein